MMAVVELFKHVPKSLELNQVDDGIAGAVSPRETKDVRRIKTVNAGRMNDDIKQLYLL